MANVNWKQPIVLDSIDTENNLLEKELKILEGWDFLILRGPAGIGKTYSPLVGAKLQKQDAFVQECSGDMGYYDLIGSNTLDGNGGTAFQAGVVASAMKNAQDGKPTLLIMDEINLLPATVLKEIGSVFDFRKSVETPIGRLYGNGHLRVIGTCNSEAESAGFELDVALQSRAIIIELKAREMSQRMLKAGMVDDFTARLIEVTDGIFSLREAEQVQALSKIFSPTEAMKIVATKLVNEERRKVVTQAIKQILGEEKGAQLVE